MHDRGARWNAIVGLVVALTVMVAVSTGCASQASANKSPAGGMAKMTCPMCTKGAPAVEKGAATEASGVQVVNILMKDGYYSPNEITIKAGTPAKLVFTGAAKDCSGKPKISELNQQADFTQTGEATMDLGSLKAGTYQITCGMGSAGGSLVVE